MRRREFIAGLGSAAAWPVAVRAQQDGQVRRIGLLQAGTPAIPEDMRVKAFKKRLTEFGWTEDRNIRFEERGANNNGPLLSVYATELARLAPDAIFVSSSPALRAMRRATSDIPIVFSAITDPVGQGFVSSLSQPGGNITGFAGLDFGVSTKNLELLKKLSPRIERVAFLYDPANVPTAGLWEEIEAAAPSLALRALKAPARTADEIEHSIAAFARDPNGGLFVGAGPALTPYRELITGLAMRHRLPAVYLIRYFVDGGGLASYGLDGNALSRGAASYVDRILKGEKPRDLPVQLPVKFELVLNLKTAKAMGLEIPVSVLALADDVVD
jgi:putative ABC transport system substrate-binding protein